MKEDLSAEIEEINDIYGDNWFSKVIEANQELKELTLEEQIRFVRYNCLPGQTNFFRDEELLKIIKHVILPDYKDKNVRVASIGCSTGQEPYSILIDNWDVIDNLLIDGYDYNKDRIKEAMKGVYRYDINKFYKYKALEGIAYKLKDNNIVLADKIKEHAGFYVHDITQEPLRQTYDIILLINVMQHYTNLGRDKIVLNLKNNLKEDGWLIFEYGHLGYGEEYDEYFNNIQRHGIHKQKTVIPQWFNEKSDVTWWSRVYKQDKV